MSNPDFVPVGPAGERPIDYAKWSQGNWMPLGAPPFSNFAAYAEYWGFTAGTTPAQGIDEWMPYDSDGDGFWNTGSMKFARWDGTAFVDCPEPDWAAGQPM